MKKTLFLLLCVLVFFGSCSYEEVPTTVKVLYEGRLKSTAFYPGSGFGQHAKWVLKFQDKHTVRIYDDDIPYEGLKIGAVYQIYKRFKGSYCFDYTPKVKRK